MTAVLQGATRLGDLLLAPLAGAPVLGLAVVSVVFGAAAVLLFKWATPQRRLSAARGRLIGRLYEAALYQQDLRVILRVQGALVAANLRYLSLALPGLLALLIPLLLVVPQLEARFGRRPLVPGETALVTVVPATPAAAAATAVWRLEAGVGLRVEMGPLREPQTGALVWRVRAEAPGMHDLRLFATTGDDPALGAVPLAVSVGSPGVEALTRSRGRDIWRQALHDPAGRPLTASDPVERLSIALPSRTLRVLGVGMPWLVPFTVVALAAGLALRRPLRIEF